MHKGLIALSFAIASVGAATESNAAPYFAYKMPGFALGLNNVGDVVGGGVSVGTQHRAFLWNRSSGATDLGSLGGDETFARDVNDHSVVVGVSGNSDGIGLPFIWQSGSIASLGTVFGYGGGATAINNLGQVTGTGATDASGTGPNHAFVWDQINGFVDIGADLGVFSYADDINDLGQVTGCFRLANGEGHGFLWDPVSGVTDLGNLGSARSTCGLGLNENGQVVGVSDIPPGAMGFHAFVWEGGSIADIGGLDPTTRISQAEDINEFGQAVGISQQSGEPGVEHPGPRAFLWSQVTGMLDLNDLLAPGTGDIALSHAFAINDLGDIIATGSGDTYLLTMRPLPSSVSEPHGLGVAALALLLLTRRARR